MSGVMQPELVFRKHACKESAGNDQSLQRIVAVGAEKSFVEQHGQKARVSGEVTVQTLDGHCAGKARGTDEAPEVHGPHPA